LRNDLLTRTGPVQSVMSVLGANGRHDHDDRDQHRARAAQRCRSAHSTFHRLFHTPQSYRLSLSFRALLS